MTNIYYLCVFNDLGGLMVNERALDSVDTLRPCLTIVVKREKTIFPCAHVRDANSLAGCASVIGQVFILNAAKRKSP
jgi:hypothetical protein